MLQFWRNRRQFMLPTVRATGYGGDAGTVNMAINTPDANSVDGLKNDSKLALFDYTTPNDPTSAVQAGLNLDAADLAVNNAL